MNLIDRRHGYMRPPTDSPSRRVLVVEDEPATADCLALLLRRWGHEANIAYDGPDALRVVATFQPAMVVLDIGLPGMDGFEVARRLRQLPGMEKCLADSLSWMPALASGAAAAACSPGAVASYRGASARAARGRSQGLPDFFQAALFRHRQT